MKKIILGAITVALGTWMILGPPTMGVSRPGFRGVFEEKMWSVVALGVFCLLVGGVVFLKATLTYLSERK